MINQSSWWYLWETNNTSKPWGPWLKTLTGMKLWPASKMTPISWCSQVSRRFRHQLHLQLSDALCTPFAEATSCVVGLSTSIGDQRLGRDAIRRWADGRELSKNHGSLEVKYLQDQCFFSFWTDHFPLNHDLWDGREARVRSPTAHRWLPCVWFIEAGCLRLVLFSKSVSILLVSLYIQTGSTTWCSVPYRL